MLVRPTLEMQCVIEAVANGDLSDKGSVVVSGEMLELKNTVIQKPFSSEQLARAVREILEVAPA